MTYQAKNFDHLFGLNGFSEQLLKNHFTLYQGYVNNTNKLLEDLDALLKEGKSGTPPFAEMQRRFGWEFDGMRLHEYYFGNVTKHSEDLNRRSPLAHKLSEAFGSYEQWEKDFRGIGSMRGIGWAILYYDVSGNKFLNVWINEHDTGHLAGCAPLLVMDVFEHAYMLDYGTKKAGYIDSFFSAIDWPVIEKRFTDVSREVAVA